MTTTEETMMNNRRDQIAEKVMLMMLEKDSQWFRDPKPLAARAYSIADAMIEEGEKFNKRDWDEAKAKFKAQGSAK